MRRIQVRYEPSEELSAPRKSAQRENMGEMEKEETETAEVLPGLVGESRLLARKSTVSWERIAYSLNESFETSYLTPRFNSDIFDIPTLQKRHLVSLQRICRRDTKK